MKRKLRGAAKAALNKVQWGDHRGRPRLTARNMERGTSEVPESIAFLCT